MYARPEVDGERLEFGVSGKLIMNALVMYDRQTDTLWSQILGRAVEGPLEGTRLEALPSMQTTWSAWRSLHPDTLALETGRGARDPYERYYEDPSRAGILGQTMPDPRLPTKAMVSGAVIQGTPVAWSWEALESAGGIINTELDGASITAVHDPDARTTLVYRSRVEGRALTFEWASDDEDAVGLLRRMVDRETGTVWQAWTGIALEGALAGHRLGQIPATNVFWFAWSDFHPDTELILNRAGDG